VVASYDTQNDKLILTSSQTGSTAIALSDDTGNFLAATGVLAAPQTVGANASYQIDSGAVQYSTTNVVANAVPGVTLTLHDVTTAPINVEIAGNSAGAVAAMEGFVEAYNAVVSLISESTKFDSAGGNGVLFGDSTLRMTEQRLHSLVVSPVLGFGSSTLRSLGDLGLGFGATGSAIGTTTELIFDSAKFSSALQSNATGVVNLLTSFEGTPALSAGGTGSIASLSGSPTKATKPGTYSVVSTVTGDLTVTFTPDDGSTALVTTGTITAAGTNTTLIPGITLTANAVLTAGTDTVTLTATQNGAGLTFQSYVDSLTRIGGVYDGRNTELQSTVDAISDQIDAMEARLERRQQALIRKYSQLEVTISRLQSQGQALSGMITQLQGIQPS
jgi:flagellar hook-associated protein 2